MVPESRNEHVLRPAYMGVCPPLAQNCVSGLLKFVTKPLMAYSFMNINVNSLYSSLSLSLSCPPLFLCLLWFSYFFYYIINFDSKGFEFILPCM